jgi:hypothetical protein
MSIADTAARLLATYGEPVLFTATIGGTYDPATGGIAGGTPLAIGGNGYPSSYNSNELGGSAIQAGDTRLICEKLSERPAVGWDCLVDELDYRVMDVQPIRKSGADIIYIVQLRK